MRHGARKFAALLLGFVLNGAAGGNRTLDTCLEGRGFTTKLQPQLGAQLLLCAGLVKLSLW